MCKIWNQKVHISKNNYYNVVRLIVMCFKVVLGITKLWLAVVMLNWMYLNTLTL